MRLRKTAAVSVLALAAGSIGMIAPATAATAPTDFTCTTPIGDRTFVTTVDTDLPTSVEYGGSVSGTSTSTVEIPDDLMDLARNVLGAESADGTTTWKEGAADVVKPVPSTPIPDDGPLVLSASGPIAAMKADKVGKMAYTVASYTGAISLKNGAGAEAIAINTECTPAAAPTADTVNVTKAKTKTTAKVKGKKKKAVVKVSVKATHGTKAGGKVVVKVKQGKKTTKAKGVVKNGKAKVVVKKLKKGKAKVTVAYKGDKNHAGSKGKGKTKIR